MTDSLLRSALRRVPRFPLATLPTPLHEAARLRAALGGPTRCPRILIKRDDLTGLALGGNKARKLEFLVADALARHADILITSGATQSNHARMTAAAACVAGLDCHLVLTSENQAQTKASAIEGNLLLDHLYGATVHHVSDEDHENADEEKIRELDATLRAAGRNPYLIPVGGSNPIGVFGYAMAAVELADQLAAADLRPTRLYYASGSRGTQAGLVFGAKACAASYRLHGVAVSSDSPEKTARALRIANDAAALLSLAVEITRDDLFTDCDFIGDGYGIPTPEGLEAIRLVARTEAILLDPTYTGKAMAALIVHIRTGELHPNETIIFLHTGGIPALFTSEFAQQAAERLS